MATKNLNSGTSYKDAGVDIEAGNELVRRIKPMAKTTSRLGADVELGGFGGLFDLAACKYNDPILVSANDGVGTKLMLAFETGIHDTIGIDLVAMSVNDLVVQGAEPLFFLDYFATGGLDINVANDVIKGIVNGCKQAGAALIGGETAEMPGMYSRGHYDLAGFAVGAVERNKILPRADIENGNVIIGIASSGLHSNGFSLVRHVVRECGVEYSSTAPFSPGNNLGEALLVPTRIYVKPCLALCREGLAKAFAHITGGGFIENIPRILPDNLAASIGYGSWELLPVFKWLQESGNIKMLEMLRTFNCGVGMVVVVDKNDADRALQVLSENGEQASVIGHIKPRGENAVEITGF
jgi:phosphoribosylformylglycinamidine cyclo-ligase